MQRRGARLNTTSNSFGTVADMNYTVRFANNLSEAQIIENLDMIAAFGTQAGIDFRMERVGHAVHFEFTNPAEYLVMRDQIAAWDHAQQSTHTEVFDQPNTPYQDAWVYQVRQTLQDAGLPHEIEETGNEAHVTLRSFGAMAMFLGLRDTGYFDVKARAMMRTQGPPAPGAWPY